MKHKYIYLIFAFLLSSFGFGQNSKLSRLPGILEEFNLHNENGPGLGILVFRGDTLHYSHFQGYANMEKSIPFSENTVLETGKFSKQVTAILIFKLIEEGKLEFDTELGKVLKGLNIEAVKKIKIIDLLKHNTGLPDFSRSKMAGGKIINYKEVIKFLNELDESKISKTNNPKFNTTDYTILMNVVEECSGKKISKYLKNSLLKPLKLKNTYFSEEKENTETNYYLVQKDSTYKKYDYVDRYPMGESRFITTPKEFQMLYEALMQKKIISDDYLRNEFTNLYFSTERIESNEVYVFGGFAKEMYHTKYIIDFNNPEGLGYFIIRIPQDNITTVVFTNRISIFNLSKLGISISNIFTKKYIFPGK